MGSRLNQTERIQQRGIGLKAKHWEFVDTHPEFNVNKFFRDKIQEQIDLQNGKERIE